MQTPKLTAIIGPTASGKSTLGLELAQKLDSEIFSIDSLSIYKEIDIASAKPSTQDLARIRHYGINELSPNKHCNAGVFLNLLHQAMQTTKKSNILIIGGSGFYLFSIIDGLSSMPILTQHKRDEIRQKIQNLSNPYEFLRSIDHISAESISQNDTYRIYKLLELYFTTNKIPSHYFAIHKKTPFPYPIDIYALQIPRDELRALIAKRTKTMLDSGIISEAENLLESYGREIQPFKAIGLKECLDFLDNKIDKDGLENLITTHTCQLAKRQETFNRSKFKTAIHLPKEKLYERILRDLNRI